MLCKTAAPHVRKMGEKKQLPGAGGQSTRLGLCFLRRPGFATRQFGCVLVAILQLFLRVGGVVFVELL